MMPIQSKASFFTALIVAALLTAPSYAKTFTVSTAEALQNTLMHINDGDTVLIEPGVYQAKNKTPHVKSLSQSNGGVDQSLSPYFAVIGKSNVTLKAADPDNKPVLRGIDYADNRYVLYGQKADGLLVQNIIFEFCKKGVVLDRSDHVKFYANTIRDIGWEALHLRDGSDHAHIKGNSIYRVGMNRSDRGESIYIGSDKKSWHPFYTNKTKNKKPIYLGSNDFALVENNIIGPDIGAELDIKEGVTGTVVRHNSFIAAITHPTLKKDKAKKPKALLHDKGSRTLVHHNTFDMKDMMWEARILDNHKHRGAIRVEQILKKERGEDGWDIYGHNGTYVYNTAINDYDIEKILYIPTDGGNHAKVGCNSLDRGPHYHSGPKSGVNLENPTNNDVIPESQCDKLIAKHHEQTPAVASETN